MKYRGYEIKGFKITRNTTGVGKSTFIVSGEINGCRVGQTLFCEKLSVEDAARALVVNYVFPAKLD